MARLPSREMISLPILSHSSHVVPCKTWAISLTSSQTGGCLFYQFLLTRGATHFHGFSMIFMFKNRFRIVVLKAFFQVNLWSPLKTPTTFCFFQTPLFSGGQNRHGRAGRDPGRSHLVVKRRTALGQRRPAGARPCRDEVHGALCTPLLVGGDRAGEEKVVWGCLMLFHCLVRNDKWDRKRKKRDWILQKLSVKRRIYTLCFEQRSDCLWISCDQVFPS